MTATSEIVRRLRTAGCVFAEDEARLLTAAAESMAGLEELVRRRTQGYPLEVILGWAEFCGMRVAVEPGVFVPRARTRLLVRQAVRLVQPGAVVVDLCCGTGAVGAVIAAQVGGVELHVTDIDPVAVRCARRNVAAAGGWVHCGDLYAALPSSLRHRVDLLVVNAPYVPSEEISTMPPEAREHEPRTALDGGADGCDIQRRVIEQAPRWLAPGSNIVIETSARQAPRTSAALSEVGLAPQTVGCAELESTVVVGSESASRTAR